MSGPLNLAQLITFLLDTPAFSGLDEVELSQLVHIMQVQHLRAGQVLFEEGRTGAAWFVVFSGGVEAIKDTAEGPRRLLELGPRMPFGEMAMLDGAPRSATVRALVDSTVLRFPREDLQVLLDAGNLAAYKLVYQMALNLVQRQRRTMSKLVEVLGAVDDSRVSALIGPLVEAWQTSA
ncbi:MAG: cyclic nucleotide-binding domain-containing protein [Alphaproteobacteria bacterium]|nr:cyclic nucleotide-binding domain-containing protein [Alphaproteobacteria bacterium]